MIKTLLVAVLKWEYFKQKVSWRITQTNYIIDNIWGADLEDMQLTSKFNKGIRFLLHVIDIFGKYSWAIPFNDKKRYYNY